MTPKSPKKQIMTPIRETQARYGRLALAVAIVCALALVLLGYKAMGKGLVLGTLFSILNFVLIGQALPYQLGHAKGKTVARALCSIVGRFTLMAIPLILAVRMEALHLPATIAGLFMIQAVILAEHSWRFLRAPREYRT